MRVGVLSDTHGNIGATTMAVSLLRGRGADFFVHCGDIGSVSVLDVLADLPTAFVWGNCDYDRGTLQSYATALGLRCLGTGGELTLAHKRLFVLHGDDAALKNIVLKQQQHDFVLQGHTHVPEDRRIGRLRLINPGALHRVKVPTVALLDLATDQVELIALPDP